LRDLAAGLRPLRSRWYVFGAQALVLWGLPRATADVDVTVLLSGQATGALVSALARRGFVLRFDDAAFIASTRVLALEHTPTGMPVDVVLGGPGLEEIIAADAAKVRVGRLGVPVATPTHLLVLKALAGRPKDREDAIALIANVPERVDLRAARELARRLASAIGEDDVVRALEDAIERASRVGARARSRASLPRGSTRRKPR
jgi:hypothetical protein